MIHPFHAVEFTEASKKDEIFGNLQTDTIFGVSRRTFSALVERGRVTDKRLVVEHPSVILPLRTWQGESLRERRVALYIGAPTHAEIATITNKVAELVRDMTGGTKLEIVTDGENTRFLDECLWMGVACRTLPVNIPVSTFTEYDFWVIAL